MMSDLILSRLDELMARLTGVEARVETLEQVVRSETSARPKPAEAVTPPTPTRWPTAAVRASPPSPPSPSHMPPPLPAVTPHPLAPALATPLAPSAPRTLETMIGRNWTSWVGGIVV